MEAQELEVLAEPRRFAGGFQVFARPLRTGRGEFGNKYISCETCDLLEFCEALTPDVALPCEEVFDWELNHVAREKGEKTMNGNQEYYWDDERGEYVLKENAEEQVGSAAEPVESKPVPKRARRMDPDTKRAMVDEYWRRKGEKGLVRELCKKYGVGDATVYIAANDPKWQPDWFKAEQEAPPSEGEIIAVLQDGLLKADTAPVNGKGIREIAAEASDVLEICLDRLSDFGVFVADLTTPVGNGDSPIEELKRTVHTIGERAAQIERSLSELLARI